MRKANQMIEELSSKDELLEYLDVDTPMIGDDGQPRKELFLKDGLHMSDAGYKIWTDLVMPLCEAVGPAVPDDGGADALRTLRR